jgi:hypothetical protein
MSDNEMSMEEYSDDDGEDEYYSDDDSYEDSNQGAGGLRPGSYDRDNDTTVQKDGLRRVKHDSTGWNVSLPIMVETPYCGCYSWLVGCLLLPFFGGCICCCPIDKKMKPKKYEDRSCCDSFWDFCFPSRRRDMLYALEQRRNRKWQKSDQVTATEAEMDHDQKRADDLAVATDLVLEVLTKRPQVPHQALHCCEHFDHGGGHGSLGGHNNRLQSGNRSSRPGSATTSHYDEEEENRYEAKQHCQYIWSQVKLEHLSLAELRECVLRHHLIDEEDDVDYDHLEDDYSDIRSSKHDDGEDDEEKRNNRIFSIVESCSRAELEMNIDRWSHEYEREEKRNQIMKEREQEKYYREAPSVWVFGVNNEGQLGQQVTSIARRNYEETRAEQIQHQQQNAHKQENGDKKIQLIEEVEGCLFPRRLDELHNKGVLEVYSGFNCSMASALTEDGDLYVWGNGDDVHTILTPSNTTVRASTASGGKRPGTSESTLSSSLREATKHPLMQVKYRNDAERFAYDIDRDTIRDDAMEKFVKIVGDYRDHQIISNGLQALVDKYVVFLIFFLNYFKLLQ